MASTQQEAEKSRQLSFNIVGWSLAFIAPAIIYFLLGFYGVDWPQRSFLSVFSCVLIFWIFKLVPYLVPIFLLIAFCLIQDIVPQYIVLSGFSSQSFLLVLFFSFLAAFILKSKIFLRPLYWAMTKLPHKFIWLESLLYFFGFILSPIVNIQNNRLDLSVPAYQSVLSHSKLINNPSAHKALLMATYAGSIYFSELFLTGKSSNLVIFEMLPHQIQTQFTWAHWFVAALIPVVIMHLILSTVHFLFFHQDIKFEIDNKELQQEISQLGRFSLAEWVALFGIILFFVGVILASLHMVALSWFCVAVLFFLLLFPVLNKREVRSYINWPFLIYLGAILGVANSIQYLEINKLLFDALPSFTQLNIYQFIISIFLICMISSCLLGTITSIILLFPILLPFSNQILLNPWLLGFIIVVACEAWIFPSQSIYQPYFEGLLEGEKRSTKRQVMYMNYMFIPCRLIGLLIAVSYWKLIGIL